MINTLLNKSYTIYIIAFAVFLIYLPNVMPAHSWVSAGVDHFDFVLAAKYHLVPHSTGFPLYMIFANIVLWLFPDTHPAWTLALALSTIPAIINIILVYYITKEFVKKTEHKYQLEAPYLAALTYAGAQILLAQTFIVEVYVFSITILLTTILFHVKEKHNWAAIFMGLGLAVHGLIWTIMFLLGLVNLRTYLPRLVLILPAAFLPYLYLPWAFQDTEDKNLTTLLGSNWKDYYTYIKFGTSGFWWGSIPIWKVPERLWDTVILLSSSFGIMFLGLILFLKYDFKKYWKYLVIISPTFYYWIGTTVKIVHVHLAIIIPLLIIFAAIGLKHSKIQPKYYAIVSIGIILTIPFFWDIGKNIDPELSAQTYYENLSQIDQENTIVLNMSVVDDSTEYGIITDGTAVWWAILMYNMENSKNMVTIFPDRYVDSGTHHNEDLLSNWYRNILKEQGINAPDLTLFRNNQTGEFYTKEGLLITPELTTGCKHYCGDPYRDIHQFQLWYAMDGIAKYNPEKEIHFIIRTGSKDRIYNDKIYTRDILKTYRPEYYEEIQRLDTLQHSVSISN